jgi:hypothetical protein
MLLKKCCLYFLMSYSLWFSKKICKALIVSCNWHTFEGTWLDLLRIRMGQGDTFDDVVFFEVSHSMFTVEADGDPGTRRGELTEKSPFNQVGGQKHQTAHTPVGRYLKDQQVSRFVDVQDL